MAPQTPLFFGWPLSLKSRRGRLEDNVNPESSHNKDTRREARYPTNDAVKVSVAPHQEQHAAKIVNISRRWLRLELGCLLPTRTRIEILTTAGLAIFGEIRYCHRDGELFYAGVAIHDAIFAKPDTGHIDDDRLALYGAGRGLSAPEVLRVKEHLEKCAECQATLAETLKMIRPTSGLQADL